MSSPQPPTAETLPLENLDTLQQILSFVGTGHYLFVAATNRKFHEVYSALFPGDQRTRLNASTEALARFCWEEIHHEIMSDADTSQKATTLIGSAAIHGNLPGLQFLRSVGCPWNKETCACAAICGNLTVLQWCRENGCSWDERTFRNASRNGHDHIVEYCRENGCPMNGE